MLVRTLNFLRVVAERLTLALTNGDVLVMSSIGHRIPSGKIEGFFLLLPVSDSWVSEVHACGGVDVTTEHAAAAKLDASGRELDEAHKRPDHLFDGTVPIGSSPYAFDCLDVLGFSD